MIGLRRTARGAMATATAGTLAAGLLTLWAGPASAAASGWVSESFTGATTGDGTWVKPAAADGASNPACLTGGSDGSASPLPGCGGESPGVLRLTDLGGSEAGAVFRTVPIDPSEGVAISFTSYSWDYRNSIADGLALMLTAADPADPTPPATTGSPGGALAYLPSSDGSVAGLSGAYLGIALPEGGYFGSGQPSGCSAPAAHPGAIEVRGPGTGTSGYCVLGNSNGYPQQFWSYRRDAGTAISVVLNPTDAPLTDGGVVAAPHSYAVTAIGSNGNTARLSGALPDAAAMAAAGIPADRYDPATGLPKALMLGFGAGTGAWSSVHEVRDVSVAKPSAPVLSVRSGMSANLDVENSGLDPDPATVTLTPTIDAGGPATPVRPSATVTLPAEDWFNLYDGSTGWNYDPNSGRYTDGAWACSERADFDGNDYVDSADCLLNEAAGPGAVPPLVLPVQHSSGAGDQPVTAEVRAPGAEAITRSARFVGPKQSSAITVSVVDDDITYGDFATAVADVTGGTDGTVDFFVDGKPFDRSGPYGVVNGRAAARIYSLPAGTHSVTAKFRPFDATALQASASVDAATLTVQKAARSLGFTPKGGSIGDTETLSATGGTSVTYAVDGTGAVCSVTGDVVTYLTAGDCTLTADQAGDDNHLAADTVRATVPVARTASTVSVTAADGTVYGDQLHLSATVGGDVAGTVSFLVDDEPVANAVPVVGGHAGTDVPGLHAGSHRIAARFVPEQADRIAGSIGYTTASIGKQPQTIVFRTVTSGMVGEALFPGAYGGDSSHPVVVRVDPTSDAGACTPNSGLIELTGPGTCRLSATQDGDDDHLAAAPATWSISVRARPSTMVLRLSATNVVFGQGVTPSVTGLPAEGTVRFAVDGKDVGVAAPVSQGAATGPALTGLGVGGHRITATWVPAAGWLFGGDSAETEVTVAQAATTTTVSVGRDGPRAVIAPVAPGSGRPTGTVAFTLDGAPFGTAPVGNGTATLARPVPTDRPHVLAAVYSGDASFTTSAGSTARRNPTVRATVSSSVPVSRSGWYRSAVTVSFTCAAGSSALSAPCPSPVVLESQGAGRSVTRTITAQDGGVATVTVTGINIDRSAPVVRISGVTNGKHYPGRAPMATCQATDALSGVASCTVATTRSGSSVTYTATATDRAGNVSIARSTVTAR